MVNPKKIRRLVMGPFGKCRRRRGMRDELITYTVFVIEARVACTTARCKANSGREPQTFVLPRGSWTKFVQIRMTGHYGSFHFCTLSLFRVHGGGRGLEVVSS